MIGVRLNTFNDNSGEPEQDANSALTELDKGLRSGKVGEQCEAIVRFPRLFEKYPFPILINSSFLKLADVFRMGNNFLRLWVLRVCQQSEKHLDKILNVDEFLRRVYSVLHSNDPVARALALRTLGAVAGIIPERQNVHHAIRRGLDSHDNVEVDAAIYATTRFAAHSNTFAVAMCNKLSDMVECESTGAERRAKLVRALRTVHGGAVRAQGVLKLLRSLLERFPSSSSVRAAITALTHIAADTVVHVPDQVELLLSLAMNDARSAVRRAALVGLRKLAEHAALWPAECIQNLVLAATDSQDSEHTMLCLEVMQILVECPAVCAASGAVRSYCACAALSPDLRQAATAAHVFTAVVVHCYEESLPVDGSDLMIALESLVIATGADSSPANIKPLRMALRCLVKLCTAEPTVYAPRTALMLGTQLQECDWHAAGPRVLALLEALAALGGGTYSPHSIQPAMPALINVLNAALRGNPTGNASEDGTALVLLCTVLFQERAGTALTVKINNSWETKIMDTIRGEDGWTRYRVARAALRYGHHSLAADILKRLADEAPSESAQRWLSALHRAASNDALLIKQGILALEAASAGWEISSGWGGAGAGAGAGCAAGCPGCAGCAPLPAAAMNARARALSALARTAHAARALCTQPPPAIVNSLAQAARDPAAKSGVCAGALRKAARAVLSVAQRYADIARTAFHADDSTLRHLHIAQHTYAQLAQFLDRVTSNQQERPSELLSKDIKAASLEEMIALSASNKLTTISAKLFDNPTTNPGITHRHVEAVLAAVRAMTGGALWARGVVLSRAGGALCRVSLTPAWRAPPADHAATLPLSHRLALKLEGVVLPAQPLSKRQKQRQVKGVQITVTATPHPRTNEKTVELTNIPPVLTAVQTVTPVRDFFSAQQLVSVNSPGLYTVAVEAAFVDEKGELWNTGPRTAIVIKHVEAVLAAVRAMTGGALWARGVVLSRAGGALCRVSLTPAWRAPPADHAATLPLSHRLALKLEGVVLPAQPLSKRQKQRQVKGVQITVTATPHPRTNEKTVELTNIPPVLTAVQTVTPVRDFFSAQQLVSVNSPGLYTVAVEAAFVDEKGELWNTGPRTAIVIKCKRDKGQGQIVTPVLDLFSAQQLVSVNSPGLYTVAVEAAFVDEKGELWNTGPRTAIVIKAHEDPTAKGIVQAARGRF